MDHQSLILFHLLCCVITVFCKAVVKCCHAHPMVFIAEHSAAGQETGLQVSICWLGFMGRSLPLGLPNAESLHRLMLQHTHPNDLSDKSVTKSKCRLFATFSVSERQKMRAVNAKWILMEATTPAGMVRAHSKHRNIHGSHEGNEGCRVAWLHEVQVQYNEGHRRSGCLFSIKHFYFTKLYKFLKKLFILNNLGKLVIHLLLQ